MKVSVFAKAVCATCLSFACLAGLVACSDGEKAQEGGSGLIAATVNDVEISEDKITAYINSVRAQMALDTDEAWGNWLAMAGYTPESLREMILDSYIEQELVRQGAVSKGVVADEATVDSYVNTMRSYYDSDEAWQTALASAGLTEDEYRSSIELSLLQQGLSEVFAVADEPTEAELVEQLSLYAPMLDGAKRSSHILFEKEDAATAQEVLDKINNGEIEFAAAAAEYSIDGSAANGGNVGLDALTTFVDEYQDALDQLSEGEVSGLVESSYGIHIIKCTYEFNAPEEITSSDQFPEEVVDVVKINVNNTKQSKAYQEWLDGYRETVNIVINPIPASVSYNIDMTPYQEATDEDDAAAGDVADAASSAVSGDAAGFGDTATPNGADEDNETTTSSDGGQIAVNDAAADASVQK